MNEYLYHGTLIYLFHHLSTNQVKEVQGFLTGKKISPRTCHTLSRLAVSNQFQSGLTKVIEDIREERKE